jgi:aryl-alcohol dehydrogenase-like predicted oxidoreductase
MEYRQLGHSGLRVSALTLGTMTFGGRGNFQAVGATDVAGARRQVDLCLDAGVNLIDTADIYSGGFAEEITGEVIAGRRDSLLLSTKVRMPMGTGPNDAGLSRQHIISGCEASLRRLGTDHIDIYHLHHPDPDTAIEETLSAADDLVRQGKVRYIGLSTYQGWQMTQAIMTSERYGYPRPVLNQVPYSLVNRWPEPEVTPAATALGCSLTCFSPLAGGALAGSATMSRPYSGLKRWGLPFDYPPEQKQAALDLEGLAKAWGYPPAHLALAWLLSRAAVASAIVGPETPEELHQNLGALDTRLTAEQLLELDAIGRLPVVLPL